MSHLEFPGFVGFEKIDLKNKEHRHWFQKVCAHAFMGDPLNEWLTCSEGRDEQEQLHRYQAFFNLALSLYGGFGWVYRDKDCRSLILLTPPGVKPSKLKTAQAMMLALFQLGSIYNPFMIFRLLSRMVTLDSAIQKMHDQVVPVQLLDRRLYLNVVAVDPDHQRQGLGSTLIKPIIDFCRQRGYICYLEASDPDSQNFWEKQGFVRQNEINLGQPEMNYYGYLFQPKGVI